MLPQLEALLRASPHIVAFHVIDNDPLDEKNFLFKIRCELTSGHTLQIRLRSTDGHLRYSYQEFADTPLRRWDNAPHFLDLSQASYHFHDRQGDVSDSGLTGDLSTDLSFVLEAL